MAAGAFAKRATVDQRLALPVPDHLSWEEAAAVPVTFLTAHDALVSNGELAEGDGVLVHAASSGVGVAAIQIARLLGADPVLGTSRSPEKLDELVPLGLDVGIDTGARDFADAVAEATGGRGVDVIVDNVGASAAAGNLACAAIGARWVNVGRLGGRRAEIDLDELSRKRVRLIGVTFRTRTVDEHAEVVRRAGEDLLPLLAEGRLRPVVHEVFPLEEADRAEDRLAADAHVGKLVLHV
jgi:NADPH:quinone reductase